MCTQSGGRAAHHEVHAGLRLEHSQRHVERQRVAGAATVAVGGHDGDVGRGGQRFAQAPDPLGTVSIVIADQNFQGAAFGCARRKAAGNILKPLSRR